MSFRGSMHTFLNQYLISAFRVVAGVSIYYQATFQSGYWCIYIISSTNSGSVLVRLFWIHHHFSMSADVFILYPVIYHGRRWCSIYFVPSTISGWALVFLFCIEHNFKVGVGVPTLYPALFKSKCWCSFFVSSILLGWVLVYLFCIQNSFRVGACVSLYIA